MHVTELLTPEVHRTSTNVPVPCTHAYFHYRIGESEIAVDRVCGVLDNGIFRPVFGEPVALITGADLDELRAIGDKLSLAAIDARAAEVRERPTRPPEE